MADALPQEAGTTPALLLLGLENVYGNKKVILAHHWCTL
jgi:hypothetical protein